MTTNPKITGKEINVHGVKVLRSSDSRIRLLKRKNNDPIIHGQKIWGSSILLMDYFQHYCILADGARVLEAGCGWGLASIYAAQRGAFVTAVDADKSVFPYLQLHCGVNNVRLKTLKRRFEQLKISELRDCQLVFGGDVCFWDELVGIWFKLIARSFRAGVNRIILADPGRGSFHELADMCLNRWGYDSVEWSVNSPRRITGYILDIKNSR